MDRDIFSKCTAASDANVVLIDNPSLAQGDPEREEDWLALEQLIEQAKHYTAKVASDLKLHPDAEVGISGRHSWYHNEIKIR